MEMRKAGHGSVKKELERDKVCGKEGNNGGGEKEREREDGEGEKAREVEDGGQILRPHSMRNTTLTVATTRLSTN